MAVPKRKVSRMKRGTRRSADALSAPTYVEDKESGELRRPHHIDLKSGNRGARFGCQEIFERSASPRPRTRGPRTSFCDHSARPRGTR